MEIELKNGEKLILEVTPLMLEYVEEYKGGIEQLVKDAKGGIDENGYSKRMYAGNQLLYAIVASNYDRPLTYRQAVRLVKLDDVERIIAFIIKNLPEQKESRTEELTLHRM